MKHPAEPAFAATVIELILKPDELNDRLQAL
jgi:hypothetical protein